jgi:hypothetical protein
MTAAPTRSELCQFWHCVHGGYAWTSLPHAARTLDHTGPVGASLAAPAEA